MLAMVSANYSKITKIYIILMTVVLVLTMTVWTILSKTLAAKVFKGYNLTWFVKKSHVLILFDILLHII